MFLSEVRPPVYAAELEAIMLSKNTKEAGLYVQEEGLTMKGKHHLLFLYKQVHA